MLRLRTDGEDFKKNISVPKGMEIDWEKPNKLVHPPPEARAVFTLAISEQNFAFAKFSLLLGQVTSTLGRSRKDLQ